MSVLVAGSSGLAGSAVMRKLLEIGESPVGISSLDVDLTNRLVDYNEQTLYNIDLQCER